MTELDKLIDAARRYTAAREAAPIGDYMGRIEEAGWELAQATRAFDKSPASSRRLTDEKA